MTTRKAIVYVVDDDDAVRDSLYELFCSAGLAVLAFSSGQEFLDGYEPGGPGCLVTDIRMPGMDGLELMEEVLRRNLRLPVIVMTGYSEPDSEMRARQLGAVDLVQKPWRGKSLVQAVKKAIARAG